VLEAKVAGRDSARLEREIDLDDLWLVDEPVRLIDYGRVDKPRTVGGHLPVTSMNMPEDI
jgi:hypothetical protein